MVIVVVPSAPVPKHRGANRLRCAQRSGRKQQVRVVRNQIRINRPVRGALRSFWFHGGTCGSAFGSARDCGSLRHCSRSGFLHLSPVCCTPDPSGPRIQWPKFRSSEPPPALKRTTVGDATLIIRIAYSLPAELTSRRGCRQAAGCSMRQRRQERRKLEATG